MDSQKSLRYGMDTPTWLKSAQIGQIISEKEILCQNVQKPVYTQCFTGLVQRLRGSTVFHITLKDIISKVVLLNLYPSGPFSYGVGGGTLGNSYYNYYYSHNTYKQIS